MKRFTLFLFTLLLGFSLQAQILHPVKWAYAAKKLNSKEAIIFIKATIEPGWHIYSAYQKDGGPVKTSFLFSPSTDYETMGAINEPVPKTRFEDAFKMNVSYFENSVIFQQKVMLKIRTASVNGNLKFMVCNDHQCLAPETITFNIPVN